MARPYLRTYNLLTPDPNGLFEDQTFAGSGNLILNGAGVVNGTWTTTDKMAHRFDFESTGDLSGIILTITGRGHKNQVITEDLVGPNNSTVTSVNYYKKITSVATNGTITTNVEAGPTDEAIGPVYVLNYKGTAQTTVAVNVGAAAINYTVELGFDDPFETDNQDITWTRHSVMQTRTETANSYIDAFARVARLKINSYSDGAIAQFVVINNRR